MQETYNAGARHHTGVEIVKNIEDVLSSVSSGTTSAVPKAIDERDAFHTQAELDAFIVKLEGEMREAAARLEFERAAGVARSAAAPPQSRSGDRGSGGR